MKPLPRQLAILFSITDFAENVVIDWKYELAEQHFHKREILLFGAVVSFAVADMNGHIHLEQYSYMVSSDYRWLIKIWYCTSKIYNHRVKDCDLVFVAYNMVLENAMRVAATLGVSVKWIFHKVTIFQI